MLNKESLGATIDSLNDAFFSGIQIKPKERDEIGRWIASRQGMKGAYAKMFAPTERDFREGFRLFTGERVTSGAATSHIIGEEACRTLILLKSANEDVQQSLNNATMGMQEALKNHESQGYPYGMYCCGTCSTAFWRHLVAGGLSDQESLLIGGMKALKAHRDSNGRWKRFPFWHTSLVLSEMETNIATSELEYIAPAIEKSVKFLRQDDVYSQRRGQIAETLLGKI